MVHRPVDCRLSTLLGLLPVRVRFLSRLSRRGGYFPRRLPVLELVIHLPRLRALEGAHQAVLVHDLHEAGSAGVPDLELALEESHRAPLRIEDDPHRLLVELVLFRALDGAGGAEAREFLVELRLGLTLKLLPYTPDLLV